MRSSQRAFLLAAAALASVTAQAAVVNFNSGATDLSANFTGTTTVTAFSWNATAGLGGTGGVAVSTDTGGANYNYNTSYNILTGESYTVSAFFKTNATISNSANQVAGVGLGTATNAEYGAGAVQSLGVSLRYPTAGGANGTLILNVVNNTGTSSNANQSTSFLAATNNWYKLTATFTKSATANTWTVSGNVQDWGSTGTIDPGTNLRSFSGTSVTNTSLYGDSSVFAGFYARQTTGNPIQMAVVDNFAVVPEPMAISMIAGAGILALRRRRA